jgi:hypothetical protein
LLIFSFPNDAQKRGYHDFCKFNGRCDLRSNPFLFLSIPPYNDLVQGIWSTTIVAFTESFMENWQVSLLTVAGVAVLIVAYAILTAGSVGRFLESRAIASRWLKDADFAGKVNALSAPPPPPPKPSAEPLWLLAVLQREGRLLDFLLEDVQGYANEQIGAAVRDIHRSCQKAIREHLSLEPVLNKAEDETVEVAAGFDPSAIRLTGNVAGQPPFKGVLRHHGWRVKELKLARPPEGQDQFVVQPAEVEVV